MMVYHEGREAVRVVVAATDGRELVHVLVPPRTMMDVYVPDVPPLRRGLCRFGDDGRREALESERECLI